MNHLQDSTPDNMNVELSKLLDKFGRDIAVSGLKYKGYSVTGQKLVAKLEAQLHKLLVAERIDV